MIQDVYSRNLRKLAAIKQVRPGQPVPGKPQHQTAELIANTTQRPSTAAVQGHDLALAYALRGRVGLVELHTVVG